MKQRHLVYLLLSALFLSAPSLAQDPETDVPAVVPLEPAASGAEASPAEVQLPVDLKMAAAIAVDAFGGEVLKADEVSDSEGLQFHIRVVNEGHVRDVVVDAANGDILSPAEEQ